MKADVNHMHFLVDIDTVMNLEMNGADQECKMGGFILEICGLKAGLEVIWDKLQNMFLQYNGLATNRFQEHSNK